MYNSYYNRWPSNNFTFHPSNIPPPPPPPQFFISPHPGFSQEPNDTDFIRSFECRIPVRQKSQTKQKISISQVFQQLKSVAFEIKELQESNEVLEEKIASISDEDWNLKLEEIKKKKLRIDQVMAQFNDLHLKVLKPLLHKRKAKRLRMQRVKIEKKKEKETKLKEMQENSRKIDENLQKIKDEVLRANQEEEAKVQADIILKEVLRKKQDAKKCVTKLDALVKLRKARQNTVIGRGESTSEIEANSFVRNIDKLKLLWTQKLALYEKEEADLRKQLEQGSKDKSLGAQEIERNLTRNLGEWRLAMFGGTAPQVDFGGNITRFIDVRSQWDQFISSAGTPIPVGWVSPPIDKQEPSSIIMP